jgi:predicted nucleic acid-binding protein
VADRDPGTFSLDSSCMVAAVCGWHERHAETAAAIDERLARRERMIVAAHALVEAYSVLTRLPPPHRLAPPDAWTLVKSNFVDQATVVALGSSASVTLLQQCAIDGVSGGRCYDRLIGACAERGKAHALLTLNPRHFTHPPKGVAVIEPSNRRPPAKPGTST